MLRFRAVVSASAVLAFAFAGCGGGGGGGSHSSLVPPIVPNATAPPSKATVMFTIVVPKVASNAHRPAYVSPATQSMTVSVTGTGSTANPTGFPMTVGLTPSSSGCTSSLASTTCTLQLSLVAGSYSASISTFDGTGGTGNELSTAQAVAFTVVANTDTLVPLTLSGIPTAIDPTYLGSGKFMVVALDADSNYIVGAGAPTFTVAKSGGASVATITQPTTSSPNAFSLAVSGTTGSETLTITAGYPAGETSGCTQQGAICTKNFTASNNQYMFVANEESSDGVLGFSVPFTSSAQTPAFTFYQYYPESGGIALDSNGNLFIAPYYDEAYSTYEVAAPYTGSETTLFTQYANSLAFDSNNNLFVSSDEDSTVTEYASPYTGSPINTFSTNYPWFIALDANNDLFVANYGEYSYVTEYPFANGSYGSPVQITTNTATASLWFDASGDLWVGTTNAIQEFKPPFSGASTPAVTITNANPGYYCPGAFDASGNLYVAIDAATGYIDEYNATTISANQGGGTISAPDVQAAGGDYACVVGVDASNNLYTLTYDGLGASSGGAAEFTLPLSNASTPLYVVTSGFYEPYYGAGVFTKGGQLSINLNPF